MAFEWKVWLLFAVLRACSAKDVLQLDVPLDGTVEQSSSDVYALTVPVSDVNQLPAVRLTVTTDAGSFGPLIVSVQQDLGVSSLQLPQPRSGYLLQYGSQIMCPFLNTPRNDSEGNTTITVTIAVSTSASSNTSYTLFAEEVQDFYLLLGDTVEVAVNPGGTALFYYQFPPGDPLQQVLFRLSAETSSKGICAFIHVEDSRCPSEVAGGTLNLQGEYQTMLGLGGILQQQPASGRIYIGITVVPDDATNNNDSICNTEISTDLLASFGSVEQKGNNQATVRTITDEAFFRKNITLRVKPGLTVVDYASAMAGMAGVFLLFYILALLVISRFAKELVLALCRGQLFGNNVDTEEEEEDEENGVPLSDYTNGDEIGPVSVRNTNAEFGEEATDGFFRPQQPASNGPEAIEMTAINRRPSDPQGDVNQFASSLSRSLPRNLEVSFAPTVQQLQRGHTLTRDTRPPRLANTITRQRTSASESSQGHRNRVAKPSVLDILSGRYEDARVRADSGSRRGTGSSTGGESLRHESVGSEGQRFSFRRAQTVSSGSSISTTANHAPRPSMRKANSVRNPSTFPRTFTSRESQGAPYPSNPNLASPSDTETQHPTSLALGSRSSSFSGDSRPPLHPEEHPPTSTILTLSGRYDDPRLHPVERPTSPATIIVASTPLDSIKEEDTLPRKPKYKPPLTKTSTVEEAEASQALIASHSSESSHGSENGTPTQVRHQPPPSTPTSLVGSGTRRPPNLQRSTSQQKEDEVLAPLIQGEEDVPTLPKPKSSVTQKSTTEPPPSSVGTPNAILDQRQSEPHGVGTPLPSPQSPPLQGEGEEDEGEERSSSAQPLTQSNDVEKLTSTLMPGGEMLEDDDRTAHMFMIELREDDCTGDFLVDPNLAEMTFPEGKDAQRQSNRFVWQLIGISLFYLLPAYQLVIAYQKFLDISGNQDLCFYNHLCSWPISIVRSVNNIWSNCGYIALGFLLFFVVQRAKYNYRRHEMDNNESQGDSKGAKEGIPQYFGIYFALSYVLIAQGFTSAAYHICPNAATFQFDTAFMYIMAGLACLRIFQSRHPDRIFSASFAFIAFAVILCIAVIGTLHADLYFYIVWFVAYQLVVVFILLQYYYRWRLTSVRTVKIKLFRRPSRPDNVAKFMFVILCLLLNIGIGIAGVVYLGDFGSHMLVVFISNFGFYMIYYIIVKMILHEWPPKLMVLYFIIAFLFWIPAIYFFLQPVTDWSQTPSVSREGNRACVFWNFYDEHDLWHFLSAFALFFSMLAIMNFDSNQRHWRRDQLKVF